MNPASKMLLQPAIILAALLAAQEAPTQSPDPFVTSYARTHEISNEEATVRIKAERAAGKLNGQLMREKPTTFAGLAIEHTPEFRVVVKFTGDARRQLAAYTHDPLYVAESAPRSLEVLRATQEEIGARLYAAGIEFASEVDLKASRVIVHVRNPGAAGEVLSGLLSTIDFVAIKETSGFIQPTNSP